jgi:hypothetical protein
MRDNYNGRFTVPPYKGSGSGEDLTPVLDPLPLPCKFIHPVTACTIRCNEIAKAKHQECKVRVKQFTEFMKTQGCPGTWCSTKKKRVCTRKQPVKTRVKVTAISKKKTKVKR